jgi:hypothetical protein
MALGSIFSKEKNILPKTETRLHTNTQGYTSNMAVNLD